MVFFQPHVMIPGGRLGETENKRVPNFFLFNLQLLKLLLPLQQSHLHLNLYFRSFHFMNRLIAYFVMTHKNESDVNLISNMFIYLFVQVFIIFFVVIGVLWLDLYEKNGLSYKCFFFLWSNWHWLRVNPGFEVNFAEILVPTICLKAYLQLMMIPGFI